MDEAAMRLSQLSGPFNDNYSMWDQVANANRNGPPPVCSGRLMSPSFHRAVYTDLYQAVQKEKSKIGADQYIFRTTMRPAVEHGIAPSLHEVRQTTLKCVASKVNHIHTDCVLFVTTIYDAYREVGTSVLVEDENMDCVKLSLYNFVFDDEDPKEVLPVGTMLAILAPYMKYPRDDRKMPVFLRCDNPQCIIKFDSKEAWRAAQSGTPSPPETEDPIKLKAMGNNAFSDKEFNKAVWLYSRAIRSSLSKDSTKVACLSNRAEAHLCRGQFEYAKYDALAALDIDVMHTKAKYRLARATLHLGETATALGLCRDLLKSNPTSKMFQSLLTDSQRAINEQQGIFDFVTMRIQESKSDARLFHADFVSPSIKVGVDIKSRNSDDMIMHRGCKAIADIGENELLTASKAFVFVPAQHKDDISLQMNPYTGQMEMGSHMFLGSNAVKMLCRTPSLGKGLYALSAGSAFDTIVPDSELERIDLPRIYNIIKNNAFGEAPDNEALLSLWKNNQARKVAGRPLQESELKEIVGTKQFETGSGVWLKESMFNHSCTPNCAWGQIGDHMFVRATRDILDGEELFISYVPLDESYVKRKEIFGNWGRCGEGFECACEFCHLMRTNRERRYIEDEVFMAHENAARMVSLEGLPLAVAANRAIPEYRRRDMLALLADFPLRLQHNAAAKLHIMDGACFTHAGDHTKALEAYQLAADIGYAVRGSGNVEHAKDLWRVAGCSMANNDTNRCRNALKKIWATEFSFFSSREDARRAFLDLTPIYAMPWWQDFEDYHKLHVMMSLAKESCEINSSAGKSSNQGKKKKDRKFK
eukprot:scaffold123972_cov51-Attheya_sp.AAC.2